MKKLVILVSGSGSNLQRIIEAVAAEEITNAEIALVVADRTCYGIERAAAQGFKTLLIPRGKDFSAQLDAALPEDITLIVLAGFLSILSEEFCRAHAGKIINIHPALLPKYGGKGMWGHHVHQAVLNAQELQSGATVHYVTAGIDEGAVILQECFTIEPGDDVAALARKVQQVEHRIYPQAIEKVLNETS